MSAGLGTSLVRFVATLGFTGVLLLGAGTSFAADCKRPQGLKGTTPHVINFAVNSTEIGAKEKEWLKDSAERYKTNKSVQVCVIGQADKTGDPEYNKKLAQQRADAVADYLKGAGLADKTFQVLGRGEAFGDTGDSFIGKLLGGESEADRRVEVIFFR